MHSRSLSVTVLALSAALALPAEQPQPLTHVAIFKVKLDKANEWVGTMKSLYVPVLQRLMADGTLLAYGVDADILHWPDSPNMDTWFAVADYAGYEKAIGAIHEAQTKNPAAMQQLGSAMDPDKHRDYLFRSVISNQKPVAAGALPYTRVSMFKAKRGKDEEFRKGFEKYVKPTYDRMVADGVIYGYSLDVEAEHSEDPGNHWMVVNMPGLGAADKLRAAFKAEDEKRSELERAAMDKQFEELTVDGTHRDFLMRSLVFAGK